MSWAPLSLKSIYRAANWLVRMLGNPRRDNTKQQPMTYVFNDSCFQGIMYLIPAIVVPDLPIPFLVLTMWVVGYGLLIYAGVIPEGVCQLTILKVFFTDSFFISQAQSPRLSDSSATSASFLCQIIFWLVSYSAARYLSRNICLIWGLIFYWQSGVL